MHPIVSKRTLFAVCIGTIAAIAATPGRAGADVDAGTGDDAGLDATATAVADAAPDAMQAPVDATVGPTGDAATPEASTGEGPIPDDGAIPTYTGGNVFQSLCVTDPSIADPTTKPFVFANVVPAYTTVAACKAFDAQGHPGQHACYCDECFSAIQQCDSLPGCREILKCELDKGCTNANTCYFTSCGTVIDKWANTSMATFITYLLFTCQTSNPTCPTLP